MGTYQIPRNYRGESRILYIFTVKSLITTAVGAMVGSLFFLLFKSLNMTPIGIGCMAFFAFVGFALGALKVPTIVMFPITKKIGVAPEVSSSPATTPAAVSSEASTSRLLRSASPKYNNQDLPIHIV